MSAFPGPYNPVVYAQFNLQGRWKRLLTFTFVYALLIGGAIWLSSANDSPAQHIDAIKGWIGGLTVLQVLDLMLFGAFRVESAVRGEITSRMIESHRLMPAAPVGSILGYLLGAPLQPYLIAIANFLLGIACCLVTGVSLDAWALVNGTLLCFALFLYSIITQHALLARGGFVILIIAAVVVVSGANDSAVRLFPSITVLIAPLLGRAAVFNQLFSNSPLTADATFAYLCSLIGQAVIAAICIRISIRRYLTANAIGVSPTLGLLLLATWAGLSVVYFASTASFKLFGGRYSDYYGNGSEQLVVAFASSFLLAMIPIASAARIADASRRSGRDAGRGFPILGTVIIAGAIICCLMIDTLKLVGDPLRHLFLTLLILIPFLVGVTCLFCWGYLAHKRAWVFVVIWVFITWVGPAIVSTVRQGMTDETADTAGIISFSAPGALSMVWSDSKISVMPGIVGQMAVTVFPVGLLVWARSRRRKITP